MTRLRPSKPGPPRGKGWGPHLSKGAKDRTPQSPARLRVRLPRLRRRRYPLRPRRLLRTAQSLLRDRLRSHKLGSGKRGESRSGAREPLPSDSARTPFGPLKEGIAAPDPASPHLWTPPSAEAEVWVRPWARHSDAHHPRESPRFRPYPRTLPTSERRDEAPSGQGEASGTGGRSPESQSESLLDGR